MLGFLITKDPRGNDEDAWLLIGGAHQHQWDAVFVDALGREPSAPGEGTAEWRQRAELKFREVEAAYPLLSRAVDYYEDAWYEPEEVEPLREECLRAQGNTQNQVAAHVLDELVDACDEALRRNWGVWLACD